MARGGRLRTCTAACTARRYGLKGVCAYAAHAEALGARDPAVYDAVQASLGFLGTPDAADPGKLLAKVRGGAHSRAQVP